MKLNSFLLVASLIFYVAACGGGDSSSGAAEQSKDLSFCVSEIIEENARSGRQYIWTNNCSESVNLSTGALTANSISTTALQINQSHSERTSFARSFIACRPPSNGVDGNDFAGLQFECN